MAPIFVILIAELSFLPTSHTTQAQLRSSHFRQMPPKAATKTKKWGRANKDCLYDLIQAGLVDSDDLSLNNINAVRHEHFCHRPVKNFCQNYKDFAAAFDLETNHSSMQCNKGGKGKLRRLILFIIHARVL